VLSDDLPVTEVVVSLEAQHRDDVPAGEAGDLLERGLRVGMLKPVSERLAPLVDASRSEGVSVVLRVAEGSQVQVRDAGHGEPVSERGLRQPRLPRQRREPHVDEHGHVALEELMDDVLGAAALVPDRHDPRGTHGAHSASPPSPLGATGANVITGPASALPLATQQGLDLSAPGDTLGQDPLNSKAQRVEGCDPMSDDSWRLLTLCAVRMDGKSMDWSLLARCARDGGLDALYDGHVPERSPAATKATPLLRAALAHGLEDAQARVDAELSAGAAAGAWLTTVLDETYPTNLSLVHDLPPFLFVRGSFVDVDALAVAVVGTRNVSDDGLRRAARMSRELVERSVTVTSGLARGVDTAAHRAALDHGGRTIAVLGTGITKCYPAENKSLLEEITTAGAVVSQFWPTRSPGRDTFPRRNRVTSGLSQGTVVIEASRTSGAKMQARLAHEHGKKVWLIHSLVTHQDWARKMVDEGKAAEIHDTSEVVDELMSPTDVPAAAPARQRHDDQQQLALEL
jgi:DNA processing protein